MFQKNQDIKQAIKAAGLRQWMVAERCGINEGSFSRMLRHELDAGKKAQIMAVIEEIKAEAVQQA